MSQTDQKDAGPEFDATPEEAAAAEWVAARRNPEDWTSERQAELDAWLAQSIAHRVAYVRIDSTWRRTERIAALRRPMRERPEPIRSQRGWRTSVAGAGAVVAIIGFVVANRVQGPGAQLIETPRGGQERVVLADGSQIELNTDTAMRVQLGKKTRAVELIRGEAYFQIKHDSARPFIVTAGTHRVIDLGTKFLVRMSRQALNVSLVEGKARLDGLNSQKSELLSPGDVAVATAGVVRVYRKSERDLSESLAWQRGKIVFHNERLADAVAELNRYGGPQLVVAGAITGKLAINGTFLTNNAEEFAGIARELFGLRVEHQNGSIILSR